MNTDVRGKRIIVMGLGRFGGGVGVSRWLAAQGADVLVTDQAAEADLADSILKLDRSRFTWRLGGHDPADLERADLLVVSPAVDKPRSEFFQAAVSRRIPWTTEMNLFLERCPANLIGITGSAGKSTTTAMAGAILEAAAAADTPLKGRRVLVGGNIGRSLLDEIPAISPRDWVILELSSFQLEDAANIRRSPTIALITNLRPNHLDRHGDMDSYANAKLNIARFQSSANVTFIHESESDLRNRLASLNLPSPIRTFGDRATHDQLATTLRVPGRHNRDNAAAALAIARHLSVPDSVSLAALADFRGLPHRLEFVREHNGIEYFNDSKSTTPESARIALEAFDAPVVILLGGYDKHVEFDDLAAAVAHRARAAICYGAVREKIAASIRSAAPRVHVQCVQDLPAALPAAHSKAQPGDVVVLSPACASYDQFINYERRGELFRNLVTALP